MIFKHVQVKRNSPLKAGERTPDKGSSPEKVRGQCFSTFSCHSQLENICKAPWVQEGQTDGSGKEPAPGALAGSGPTWLPHS